MPRAKAQTKSKKAPGRQLRVGIFGAMNLATTCKWRNIKKHVKGLERQGWQITSIDGGPDFQRTRVELDKS